MALMEFARQKQVKPASVNIASKPGADQPGASPAKEKLAPVQARQPVKTAGNRHHQMSALPGAKRPATGPRKTMKQPTPVVPVAKPVQPQSYSTPVAPQIHEPQAETLQTSQPMPELAASEIATLKSLAALQMKYGQPQEAAAYLMMVRKFAPNDADALRLLVAALIKLKRNDQADVILAEYEALTAANQSDGGLGLLYRSIVAFRTSGIATARGWFDQFRKFVSGGVKAGIK